MRLALVLLSLAFTYQADAQPAHPKQGAQEQEYLSELKITGKQFSAKFYSEYARIYSLPEQRFVAKIDSARTVFNAVLSKYKNQLDTEYFRQQQTGIKYYFDKLLIDYPVNHDIYIGQTFSTPSSIPGKLKNNLADFNNPALLTNTDFTNYVRAFLSLQLSAELKKSRYRSLDNQQLNACWNLIPEFISDKQCRSFWQAEYLYNHIDNNGIKNIEAIYRDFKSTCTDTTYINKVAAIYKEDSIGRTGHLIRAYKTAGSFNLDMHIFLPGNAITTAKRPVIIYFHGGSWSEGKPDWFFYECNNYAKKGWVACAVEYRTYSRFGTLPFEAVKDARSAIRWLRQHAGELNIDTNRIVASGNSAGGHLVICTALANKWNEKTDDLHFSPIPNILMVNAGVYDLTDEQTAWIRKDLQNKEIVKQISPTHLVKKDFPPALIIHGTNDENVSFETAKTFTDKMANAGNNTIQFQPLGGAGHFIWYDPQYSSKVSKLRKDFLYRHGYYGL